MVWRIVENSGGQKRLCIVDEVYLRQRLALSYNPEGTAHRVIKIMLMFATLVEESLIR